MKKFLSIWMLMFLLWALPLPAAAEEVSPAQLYAKLKGEDAYVTELTIPVGLKREVSFFTKKDEEYVEVAAAPVVSNDAIVELKGAVNPFQLTAKAKGTVEFALQDSDGNPLSESVTVNVPESCLEISRKSEDNWATSLSGIRVNEEVDVDIRLGADGVFDFCAGMAEPSEGLIRNGEMITAGTAGTYTLTYKGYSVSVMVEQEPTNDIPISRDDLEVLADQEKFNQFLSDNHYSGSGDLTLVLPAGELGSVNCNVQLDNGAGLILKGVSGTRMKDLTIETENVTAFEIEFSGSPAITVKGVSGCKISNCTFKNSSGTIAIGLWQNAEGRTPVLTLENNSFIAFNVRLRDSSGTSVIGSWQSIAYDKAKAETIDFRADVKTEKDCVTVYVPENMKVLADDGWRFKWIFNPGRDFYTSFVAYEGEKIDASVGVNTMFEVPNGGLYSIVKGTLPELVKKDDSTKTLTTSAALEKYLRKITVSCSDFKAVQVTDSKGKTVKCEKGSDGKLTIWLDGNSPYTIKNDTTTKTVTKTVTKPTSRSYKYTYQDYYLVTPAGFASGMRYVKDNLVTLDCTQAGKKPISLPVASMAEAAEKGYSVLVKTKDAELTLDAAALKSLAQQAKGTTVLLHYKSLNHKTLTTVGQASIQSHLSQFPGDSADLAFLVTATSDSETIEDLQKGTVTLKIPFIVLPGTEEMENRVYALQSESLSEARETAVADGYLTTTLLDLTEHMVFQVGEPVETTEETTEATVETTVETTPETTQPETEPETTAPTEPVETPKKSGGLIIGLGLVLVSLCGVAGFPFLRKRFQK